MAVPVVKNHLPMQKKQRDVGFIPGDLPGRCPGERNGNLLSHSYLKKPHGQRRLAA